MFITAADIGKFLSEIVIRSYSKLLELIEWIGSIIDAIRDCVRDDEDSIDSRSELFYLPLSSLILQNMKLITVTFAVVCFRILSTAYFAIIVLDITKIVEKDEQLDRRVCWVMTRMTKDVCNFLSLHTSD